MLVNCAECGFETANKELFWCHMGDCHQQNHSIKRGVDATEEHKKVIPIKCTECEYQSNESREFRNHSIEVHKNERPFKCIKCDDCVSRYKACICTHAKKNHNLNMCSFCDSIYEIEKDLDIHVNINHQKRVYIRCPDCKFQSDAANNSDQIPVTNPEEAATQNAGDVKSKGRGRIHKCSQCNFTCNFSRGLIIHNRANHVKPTFACSLCVRTFSSELFVENHIKRQHPKKTPKITPGKFKCSLCKFSSKKKNDLNHHYNTSHLDYNCESISGGFKCRRCRFFTTARWALKKHQSKEHATKKCFVCGLPFVGEKNLTNHIELFHSNWECQICSREFVNESDFLKHCILEHEVGEPFQCIECNLRTSSMKELKTHVNLVHSNPIHKCVHCIFGASTKIGLARHMSRVHGETKCPQCLLCFDRDDELAVHFYLQHKDTFQCDRCDFGTDSQQVLMNHKTLNHFVSKHFQCSACEFSSKVLKELKKHVRNEHKGSKTLSQNSQLFHFKCSTCDLILSRKEDLAKHLEEQHPDFNDELRNLEERKMDFVESEEIPEPAFEVKTEIVEEVNLDSMNASEPLSEDPLSLNDSTKCSFQCSYCQFEATTSLELTKHKRNVHNIKKVPLNLSNNVYHQCPHCKFNCLTKAALAFHLQTHIERCQWPGCEEIFTNQANMSLHVKTDHLKYVKCSVCDMLYPKLEQLMEHMKSDHPNSDSHLEVNNTTGVDGLENRAADINETRTDDELVDGIKCEVIEEPERIFLDSNVIVKTEEMDTETDPMDIETDPMDIEADPMDIETDPM